jgi:hypothetical protein
MNKLAAAALLTLFACTSPTDGGDSVDDPPVDVDVEGVVVDQTRFDFTNPWDRGLFEQHDLEFVEAIGPYAAFRITGPSPALVGPAVRFSREDGAWAMLCGASRFFAEPGSDAAGVAARMLSGDDVLIDSPQSPGEYGGCAKAADAYGDRFDNDGEIEDDGDGVEFLSVDFDDAVPQGSTVLLRQIALFDEKPGHNDSHVIPEVCCTDSLCGLDEPPADDDPNRTID